MHETETLEFKKRLNDKLEKEIVGFLNTVRGGSLYIGVDGNGNPVGIDDIDDAELEIKDRIKNNIFPSPVGLFEIVIPPSKDHIQIIVSGGDQRPYFIKKQGMCPEGCYVRAGTSVEKMSEETILTLFQKRDKRTLQTIPSEKQDLTFSYLKEAYGKRGYKVGDNFLKQLELFTLEGKFNKLAYLLSDQFASPFQYVRYRNDDVFDLSEQKAFQGCSILKSASALLDYIESRNTVCAHNTPAGKKEEPRFNASAMRELVVNAIVHNDYRGEAMPSFAEFPSRFEISSFGRLPDGFTKEDFFNDYSLPVNPELIRVFRDLGFAQRLGTGIRRVLRFYPKEIFSFSPSFLRVSVPLVREEGTKTNRVSPLTKNILKEIRHNPSVTRDELAARLGVSESTIYREISALKAKGVLRRVGQTKNGHWEIHN